MTIKLKKLELWFVTGSQHLYGEETLKQVAEHSTAIAKSFNEQEKIAVSVHFKPVLTTPDAIYQLMLEANASPHCIGLICWMHTFSPAKMWIRGLNILKKPLLHLHTQYNRDIPWASIDMDFMNLNQSAHGDREFGFIGSRMRINRKVVVGHWQDVEVIERINVWSRVAAAWHDWQGGKLARIGDNMRQVAVTEGDKVQAEMQFGYSVNGYGVGDVVEFIRGVGQTEINTVLEAYENTYHLADSLRKDGAQRPSLIEAARIEVGIRAFFRGRKFYGFHGYL